MEMGEKMSKKLPRYSIVGPPFMTLYAIADDWLEKPGMTEVLQRRYGSRTAAEKDCKLLNAAQAILSAGP